MPVHRWGRTDAAFVTLRTGAGPRPRPPPAAASRVDAAPEGAPEAGRVRPSVTTPARTHRTGTPHRGTRTSYRYFCGWRFHGPVMASMIPGVWMLAYSVRPSGENVTPVNSLYSGSAALPVFSSLRAMG